MKEIKGISRIELNRKLYKVLFTKTTQKVPDQEFLESLGLRFVTGWSDQGYWGIIPSIHKKDQSVPLSVSKDGNGRSGVWWGAGCRLLKKGENVRSIVKTMDLVGILAGYTKERIPKYYHTFPICPRIVAYRDAKRTIKWSSAYLPTLHTKVEEAKKTLEACARYEAQENKKIQDAQAKIDAIMKEVRK